MVARRVGRAAVGRPRRARGPAAGLSITPWIMAMAMAVMALASAALSGPAAAARSFLVGSDVPDLGFVSREATLSQGQRCWIEYGMPPPPPNTKVRATPRRKVAHRSRSVSRHRPRAASSRHPSASPILAPSMRLHCLTDVPPVAAVAPFAGDLAKYMEPIEADEMLIQLLIAQRRGTRAKVPMSESRVSAAPEPEGWLFLLGGFLILGLALRHRALLAVN